MKQMPELNKDKDEVEKAAWKRWILGATISPDLVFQKLCISKVNICLCFPPLIYLDFHHLKPIDC